MVSSSCSRIWRFSTAPVASMSRSARVDLPWSMCATMQKFRMVDCDMGGKIGGEAGKRGGGEAEAVRAIDEASRHYAITLYLHGQCDADSAVRHPRLPASPLPRSR